MIVEPGFILIERPSQKWLLLAASPISAKSIVAVFKLSSKNHLQRPARMLIYG
jgi:hypothetical protein